MSATTMAGLPIVMAHAGSTSIDEATRPPGARRYHWPTAGPLPGTPLAYNGSFGAVARCRRSSGTAYWTSASCESRCASCADVTPSAKTTWVRSATGAPSSIATPSRAPSALACIGLRGAPGTATFGMSDESDRTFTITRALEGGAPAVCAGVCSGKLASSASAGAVHMERILLIDVGDSGKAASVRQDSRGGWRLPGRVELQQDIARSDFDAHDEPASAACQPSSRPGDRRELPHRRRADAGGRRR